MFTKARIIIVILIVMTFLPMIFMLGPTSMFGIVFILIMCFLILVAMPSAEARSLLRIERALKNKK